MIAIERGNKATDVIRGTDSSPSHAVRMVGEIELAIAGRALAVSEWKRTGRFTDETNLSREP